MTKQEIAIQFIKDKQYEEAAKLLVELIEDQPEDPINYINFGNLLEITNQIEEAERFFLKAIELDENSATAFVSLGNLYFNQKLYDQAEKMLKHAIHLGVNDGETFYLLGMVYYKQKQLMLSIPFLQRAVELTDDVEKMFQYGLALAQVNYLKEAKEVFVKVIDKEHSHADANYNLGIIYVREEKWEEALEYLNRALVHQPDHKMAKQARENVLTMIDR
ncbi:tetratricopeptide repeat protein [Pseudogracilibacillus sp. SE30717A]|uniref:tetratricopeptide repeat protein n=1 Tax=Pseudogracilibacillus sp. SE30717A TaxID=3098293 RepID=UPI00300E0DDF